MGAKKTRWGLILRTVGESAEAARAMGYDVNRVRLLATERAARSPASAARFCRCSTRAAGTRIVERAGSDGVAL